MEESSLPRGPDGKIHIWGWFCVDHFKGRLRLIFDHRPQNATEETLRWPDLPSGLAMIHLKLELWETVRGSGDDLECWYYCLRHKESWYANNVTGRRVRGERCSSLISALSLGSLTFFVYPWLLWGTPTGWRWLRKATRPSYNVGAACGQSTRFGTAA